MRAALCFLLCLAPRLVAAQDSVFRASLVTAVVAHSMDLAETEHCLGAKTCEELNPWLLRFESPSGFAIAKMGLASLTLLATARKIYPTHPKWAIAANIGQTVLFAAIAAHNAKVTR